MLVAAYIPVAQRADGHESNDVDCVRFVIFSEAYALTHCLPRNMPDRAAHPEFLIVLSGA
jgi:hypothetical protein